MLAPAGSRAFDERLGDCLSRLAAAVDSELGENRVVLLLGGGYGRDEGAVVVREGVERAYNDLDLTLVVRRRYRDLHTRLRSLSEQFQKELEIEVDFSRPLTPRDVAHWPHWLMWHDLLHGHRVLSGAPDWLVTHAPIRVWSPPPPSEAARLLLNRGAGLLWSLLVVRGLRPYPDRDFVRRNVYKAYLALGDAVLLASRRYSTFCRLRETRLAELVSQDNSLARLPLDGYTDALRFKLMPDDLPTEQPEPNTAAQAWLAVFLFLEGRRLRGLGFNDAAEASGCANLREVDESSFVQWPRNLLRNFQGRRLSLVYPRERLFRELPLLLESGCQCNSPRRDWEKRSERFLDEWSRFN